MLAIVTSLYASLIAFMMVALAFRVTKFRRKHAVGLGDGDNQEVTHAMRLQANLFEYAPLFLILLLVLELNQASTFMLHVWGALFVFARAIHVWGFASNIGYSKGRFFGTVITFLVLVSMALANVYMLMRTL